MKISIFGLGYVGCVTMGCLSQFGNEVIGVDIEPAKVRLINKGKPTIIEKQIEELILQGHKNKTIRATDDFINAVVSTDISIICVGTPSTHKGSLNMEYILKVAHQIGEGLKLKDSFHTIAIRSTVLPGTNDEISKIISLESGKIVNKDFGVVSNPEFLREGSAVFDFINPPITVLGSDSDLSIKVMTELYKEIKAPVSIVEVGEAEIIKYVNNSFHALKVSFANEIGNICKALNIDSRKVMELFCKDHHLNISEYYFKPGFAYGGSCLPKDLKGLSRISHDFYLSSPLLNSIEVSNENHKRTAIDQITHYNVRSIGIIGLSFKFGTDDLRNSPIVEVAEYFIGKGYNILIFDQNVSYSRLSGTNKVYIESKIPHLSELLVEDLSVLIDQSDLIVINHKLEGIINIVDQFQNKYFLDLVGIENNQFKNYAGICW